jgi:MarR family 2-MHQ and catechol resistance regulon transcriptional repressor
MNSEKKFTSHDMPEGVHVWLVLMKAYDAIMKLSATSFRQMGLCDSDFRVLEVLLHLGALPVNVIGPKVNLTPGSISVAVERLHSRGFVSRIESPDDRRVRVVELTGEGRAVIDPIFREHARRMEAVFEPLASDQRVKLEQLLKIAGRHAEQLLEKD